MTGSSKESTTPAWEFYDLEKDPHENHNAYNDITYSEIIKEMKIELKKQRQIFDDTDLNYPELQEIFNNYWN
jgi:hypothetical protein